MNLIKYRNIFYIFSLIIIIPGLLALFTWNLKLGIDFSGGTLWEVKFEEKDTVSAQELRNFLEGKNSDISQISSTGQNSLLIRTKISEESKINEIKDQLTKSYGKTSDLRLETVGPTISKELTQKAMLAVGVAILGIVMYVTWAFRKVEKPASGLSFGICTIIALVHDVIVVVGVFAILGHFFAIEVDSLFITAILTVVGFSVHDTIVVFDRIRENLKKNSDQHFEIIVNNSILQTLTRSLNTSLTAVFVLVALLIFGGEPIRYFVLALIIGIISGTYSSIFNASPLLVTWQNLKEKYFKK